VNIVDSKHRGCEELKMEGGRKDSFDKSTSHSHSLDERRSEDVVVFITDTQMHSDTPRISNHHGKTLTPLSPPANFYTTFSDSLIPRLNFNQSSVSPRSSNSFEHSPHRSLGNYSSETVDPFDIYSVSDGESIIPFERHSVLTLLSPNDTIPRILHDFPSNNSNNSNNSNHQNHPRIITPIHSPNRSLSADSLFLFLSSTYHFATFFPHVSRQRYRDSGSVFCLCM